MIIGIVPSKLFKHFVTLLITMLINHSEKKGTIRAMKKVYQNNTCGSTMQSIKVTARWGLNSPNFTTKWAVALVVVALVLPPLLRRGGLMDVKENTKKRVKTNQALIQVG